MQFYVNGKELLGLVQTQTVTGSLDLNSVNQLFTKVDSTQVINKPSFFSNQAVYIHLEINTWNKVQVGFDTNGYAATRYYSGIADNGHPGWSKWAPIKIEW